MRMTGYFLHKLHVRCLLENKLIAYLYSNELLLRRYQEWRLIQEHEYSVVIFNPLAFESDTFVTAEINKKKK